MLQYLLMSLIMLFSALHAPPTEDARPQAAAADAGALTVDSTVDQILDALHARGADLQSLSADVELIESDASTGDFVTRDGRFLLQTLPDGSARARITFDTRTANNRKTEDKVEYLLDGRNLIDRTWRTKTQVTRQVLKPGEKVNLLKLGEGPFPLPIGQPADEVHRMFEVTRIDSGADDPANTVHVRLTPRADSQFANRFHTIDAWVDLADHMPKRIETVDPNGVTVRTTELGNVRINPKLTDADFALDRVGPDWDLYNEAYQD